MIIINDRGSSGGVREYQNQIEENLKDYPSVKIYWIEYKKLFPILNHYVNLTLFKNQFKNELKNNSFWLTFNYIISDFFLKAKYKVVTIHDAYFFINEAPLKRKMYVWILNLKNKFKRLANYDKIIAISELTKDYLIKDFSFPEEKIEVIYPFISKDYFNKYNKKSNSQKIIIGWINNNNFNKIKKLFEFLNLFIKYAPNNFEVHIYGK
ncbi:MAG: glycosyltransferase family 4 protein, partial [Candidatus Parvarchaeota archaeon]|nr:glycosyltransferase family 4 protein [Candidatus Rehaiarchaeum fermentans]